MQLESKYIIPYLPFGIKGYFLDKFDIVTGFDNDFKIISSLNNGSCLVTDFKPALRNLSDLTKEIEVNGKEFVPIDKIINQFINDYKFNDNGVTKSLKSENSTTLLFINNILAPECSFGIYTILVKWHFDVFGLIEAGLAIDINTL